MPTEDTTVKLYLSIGEAERQFNTIQNHYRLLASTWTLASIAGIGFVLTKTLSPDLETEKYLVCSAIAFSGAVSILILWVVDVRVYQRLLGVYFNEGMAMEKGGKWLPQIRNQTRGEFKGWVPRLISLYYIFAGAVGLITVSWIWKSQSPDRNRGSSPQVTGEDFKARVSSYEHEETVRRLRTRR